MLVTCLCVTTRARRAWFANALMCFESQTHAERDLLVVTDDDADNYLYDIALSRGDMPIHVVMAQQTIGEKRNIGCQMARGDIIAHWDDDDWSSPLRLENQLEILKQSGKAVTAFNSMKFTDGVNWWLYDGIMQSVGVGASLCYRRKWWNMHRFQPLQVGEDNAFISEARRCGQYATRPAGDLMYATIHARNTSPRDLRGYTKLCD